VWLTTRRNPLCWPLGLVSVLLYGWVFYGARLYSDALLQVVYAALECYGWWCWRRARSADHDAGAGAGAGTAAPARPQVRVPARTQVLGPLAVGALGAVLLGELASRYTDAAVPWLDAALTAFSLVAQYWMARLYRLNWLLWIAVDVVYVGLYGSRQLPVTAVLYAGFLVLAVLGWQRWGPQR
jgi:nicotinamide mononucleotide transporter